MANNYKKLDANFTQNWRNDLNANFDSVDKDIKSQKTRVDNLIQNAPQPSEVVDMRQDTSGVVHPTAKERIDTEFNKVMSDLAQTTQEITNKADTNYVNGQLVTKADKSYVDTEISKKVSGSPKGTYATLTALQTAFPTGAEGVYVVLADGKWYYWTGSAWTAGGVYQSTAIADKGVSKPKLSDSVNSSIKTGTSRIFGTLQFYFIDRFKIEIIVNRYALGYFAGGGTFVYIPKLTQNVILDENQSLVYDLTTNTVYVETKAVMGSGIPNGGFVEDNKIILVSNVSYGRIMSNVKLEEVKTDDSGVCLVKGSNYINVYVKSEGDSYICYHFLKTTKAYIAGDKTSNVDVWHFRRTSEYVREGKHHFTLVKQFLTTDATQDLMIRQNSVTDYMGGAAHGDEIKTTVKMFLDDRELDENATYTNLYGKEFKIYMTSNLYKDTETTGGVLDHLATARKIFTVNKVGYDIDVEVEFHKAISLREALFGAMSMSRQDQNGNPNFTQAVIGRGDQIVDLTVVDSVITKTQDTNRAFLKGDGFTCDWRCERKHNISGNGAFINRSAVDSAKLYFNYVPNDYMTSIGEKFQQRTFYKFRITR